MAILRRFTPLVEPVSIDEAFLDVTGTGALFGAGEASGAGSRTTSRRGATDRSVGVASTKLVAKIASDLRKPDGLVVVAPGDEATFLAPLPISRLWGVGPSRRRRCRIRRGHDRRPGGAPRRSARSGDSASTALARRSGAGARRDPVHGGMPRNRSATSTRSTSTRRTAK